MSQCDQTRCCISNECTQSVYVSPKDMSLGCYALDTSLVLYMKGALGIGLIYSECGHRRYGIVAVISDIDWARSPTDRSQ